MKFLLIACFSAIWMSASNAQVHPAPKDPESFHFLVAGHVYGAPNTINKPFHPTFMLFLEKYADQLDFLVLTGDVVQHSDSSSWDAVQSYLGKLSLETIIAPGNHDLKDPKLFETHFGKSNYFFEIGDHLFLVLDLLPSGWNVPMEMMAALKQQLHKKEYRDVFIFTHHICWQDDDRTPQLIPNSTYGRDDNQRFYAETLPLLHDFELPIYLIGGDVGATANAPALDVIQDKNVHLIASGMGAGTDDNVLIITVQDEKTALHVIQLDTHTVFPLHLYIPPSSQDDKH